MSLRILSCGVANFQDRGRPGYRKLGVPMGGCFDTLSHQVANLVLGNAPKLPVIEFLGSGARLQAESKIALGLAGAHVSLLVNGQKRQTSTLNLEPGDVVDFERFLEGNCLVMSTPGGWIVESILGSVSGQALGELLIGTQVRTVAELQLDLSTLVSNEIPFVPNELCPDLHRTELTVSLSSNRLGIRLSGGQPHQREQLSQPQDFGSIQWTPSGELIIVGPDGPTLGGYPRIGFVPRSFLPRVAQLRPLEKVHLCPVSKDDIETANAEATRRCFFAEQANRSRT